MIRIFRHFFESSSGTVAHPVPVHIAPVLEVIKFILNYFLKITVKCYISIDNCGLMYKSAKI